MNRVLLAVALIVASPAIAAAQDLEPDPIPSPDEPSDEDLIRWASREVGRQAGRLPLPALIFPGKNQPKRPLLP